MSLDHLLTEARNPNSANLDELSPLEIARLMNREDMTAVEAVGTQAEFLAQAIEIIADRLASGGRLVYIGAGTSGRLGVLDAAECPPTFNSPPSQVVGLIAGGREALTRAVEGAEDHPDLAKTDLDAIGFNKDDVLVGIATSGRTPYVIGGVQHAKSLGASTIGLVCNPESELHALVDLMICPVVGPEVLSGSTRLKSGTATKLVLNTLTTGAMARLGKCYGNLMVDLRATNQKLKARTNRIVRLMTGVDEAEAKALLDAADGELKTALVGKLAEISPDEARKKLAEAHGKITSVLKSFKPAANLELADDLVIGIDGGGSSTVALLADRNGIIGRGESGPSNLQAVGVTRAMNALKEAIRRSFESANRPLAQVSAAVFGLAGADRPQDQQLVKAWAMKAQVASRVDVVNDAAVLLAAGTPKGFGVALVAGTGSIAFAKSPAGQIERAGGWGYLLGDEGSGYALVMDALKALSQAADGRGPKTAMTEPIQRAFNVTKPMDMIPAIYRSGVWDRTSLAALAPHVLAAAEAGDTVAAKIANDNARQLAVTTKRAAEAVGLPLNAVPLAVTGGTLLGSEYYRKLLIENLELLGVQASPLKLVHEPAEGGVSLAHSLAIS